MPMNASAASQTFKKAVAASPGETVPRIREANADARRVAQSQAPRALNYQNHRNGEYGERSHDDVGFRANSLCS
jgi:hypothetical protein